jgi:glycosyltransferase involved in cell wall biosynthesis
MIATRVGGIPEIFGPAAAHLVAPENPAALAAAIESALDEPDLMARSAAAIRGHVQENFSQDAMVEGVLRAYREALDHAASK